MKEVTHLVVDQGNTATKIALFQHTTLLDVWRIADSEWPTYTEYLSQLPQRGIVSSVRQSEFFPDPIAAFFLPFDRLRGVSPLPFQISYGTEETLGADRIANAAGAISLYANQATFVVDLGTCLTTTLVVEKRLLGGSISPGMNMRFTALNTFTGRLPLEQSGLDFPSYVLGTTTSESIRSGVCSGILGEIQFFIDHYCKEYEGLNVLLTGGDCAYFAPRLKSPIFAEPNLTLIGLNEIFHYRLLGAH
jgi:type III pantothenate kinase